MQNVSLNFMFTLNVWPKKIVLMTVSISKKIVKLCDSYLRAPVYNVSEVRF